ncbi:MAG: hypothetical protein AAF704_13845 [Cyanobacteria bacterium P01_D01_bin.123]
MGSGWVQELVEQLVLALASVLVLVQAWESAEVSVEQLGWELAEVLAWESVGVSVEQWE